MSVDINEILKILPHRFPFLLVDRVEEFKEGEGITVRKAVTVNEPFFPGHFPQEPVFPGVLIIEAMAQACGLYVGLCGEMKSLFYLAAVENARFLKPVRPGDLLIIKAEPAGSKLGVISFNAKAYVDGVEVARCRITAAQVRK